MAHFLGGIFVDNSFDKLNNEFAEQARGGFKYVFWMICSYICDIAGLAIGIYALLPDNNRYLALLTLLGGLFGVQTNAWAKGTQPRNLALKISFWAGMAVCALACVILYIILPYVNG